MEETIIFAGLALIIIGFLASFGVIRFAPGYTKIAGIPVGIIFIAWGLNVLGWI